jgi:hypothetical protein
MRPQFGDQEDTKDKNVFGLWSAVQTVQCTYI